MQRLYDTSSWRARADEARTKGQIVGLVPTMGALHDGHSSLMQRARDECDVVVVTIFVNPRQFGDANDLANYPRTPEADASRCVAAGVDVLVEPTLEQMWPDYPETRTTVHVAQLGDNWEGRDRPGHFDGVTSVVAKLFNVTGPCRAYFGEKDFQQLAIVRRMVRDLSMAVEVVGCPIIRDPSGLALSSRNIHLSASGRERALSLSRTLARVATSVGNSATAVRQIIGHELARGDLDVAYADVVDPDTLLSCDDATDGSARVLLAARVDGVRVIDNGTVTLTSVCEN